MKTINAILGITIVGGLAILIFKKKSGSKLEKLIEYVKENPDISGNRESRSIQAINEMTPQEVDTLYDVIFNYNLKNIELDKDSELFKAMVRLVSKYPILE